MNENKAVEFEKKHGSVALLKASYSSLTRLLVKKGLITEAELVDEFNSLIEDWDDDTLWLQNDRR